MADVNPALQTSTWGGGTGLTVIYGVAAPVKTPDAGLGAQAVKFRALWAASVPPGAAR
jgi:hypothetical protein